MQSHPSISEQLGDRMSSASLDALAIALSIQWPAWYPPFVIELAKATDSASDFWLPGGFLFASPRRALEETVAFRNGEMFYSGAPSIEAPGPKWPPRPLPPQFIVVGRTGQGPVIIDTLNAAPILLWLDNEGSWRKPLIDFAAMGKTPSEIAKALIDRPVG